MAYRICRTRLAPPPRALLVLLLIAFLALFDVVHAAREDPVDQDRQRMRRGRDRLGRSQATPHPPVIGPQGGLALVQVLGGQPQRLGGPVPHPARPPPAHFATRDLMVGTQAQPGAEVLFRGKAAQVRTPFTDHRLHRHRLERGQHRQIDARHFLQPLTVLHVRLAARQTLRLAGIDQIRVDAVLFQPLRHGDPVHPRRFDRDRVDPTGLEPARHLLQIRRQTAKAANRLRIALRRDGDLMALRAHLEADRLRVQNPTARFPSGSPAVLRVSAGRRTRVDHGITPCPKGSRKYRSDPQGIRATYSPKRDSQTVPPRSASPMTLSPTAEPDSTNGHCAPLSLRPHCRSPPPHPIRSRFFLTSAAPRPSDSQRHKQGWPNDLALALRPAGRLLDGVCRRL